MSRRLMGVLILVGVFGIAPPALAFVIQTADTIKISETLRDDLYAAGTTVQVDGTVDGDVTTAGRDVSVEGNVTGVVLAAGREVQIGGKVGRTVRVAGQHVSIVGSIGSDAVAAAADVTVAEQARIGRDLLAAGKDITVNGDVHRYARLTGGAVVVAGKIGEGLRVDAQSLTLMPSAVVGGDIRYSAEAPIDVRPGAQIKGKIERVARPTKREFKVLGLRGEYALRLWEALGLLVIGLAIVSLTPQGARNVASNALRRFPISLAVGVVLLVAIPLASTVLAFTLIGIPLAATALLTLAVTAYCAQAFVATGVGQVLVRTLMRDRAPSIRIAVALGTLILAALFAVPYGWIVRLVVMCVGVGAFALTLQRALESPRGTPPASGAAVS